MKSDSAAWWILLAAALAAALASRLDLIREVFPFLGARGEAGIELAALLIGIVAGVLRGSPLPRTEWSEAERAVHAKAIEENAMGWNWRKIGTGFKVALDTAIDLQDAHLIKVKGLDKAKTIRDVIDKGHHAPAPAHEPVTPERRDSIAERAPRSSSR